MKPPFTLKTFGRGLVLPALIGLLCAPYSPVTSQVAAADLVVSGRPTTATAMVGTINGAAALLTMNAETKSSTASTPFILTPGYDIGIWINSSAASSGTANNVIGFNVSAIGATNFSTTLPITLVYPNTGATATRWYGVIGASNLVGVSQIRWDSSSTTQANLVTISQIQYSFFKTK